MTREKVARLGELQTKLQDFPKTGLRLTPDEAVELRKLVVELAASPEVADDKTTWLVNESRRPQLNGTDYNDTLKRMCFEEVGALALKYGLPMLQDVVAGLKG